VLVASLPSFAKPSAQGIQNFYKVDEHVYRGAQPADEGFRYLANLGLKTVVNLRESDARSAREAQIVTALGMRYVNIPMTGLTPPSEADITRILALLEDGNSGGVFVHCKRGADRTGAVIAAYRIDRDHWDNYRALKEAMACGMALYQLPRMNYIRTFQARTNTPGVQVATATLTAQP
jgi:protein tyrosine/serine phosphatase